ncbi:hypothetical protein BN873_130010 [Candidatus Competibacter denitrificans Run_A_D11]|uniref:Uncharacterized protein n=1 Tax=Candidatus Competibacter denitrificans Run_A_D11 TaxID=1400863 RepID=W6M601_9GAMM|nr:hypothetical protein BN873_130010 [Candidatus Competibacter denitrificans Run_A_D11]
MLIKISSIPIVKGSDCFDLIKLRKTPPWDLITGTEAPPWIDALPAVRTMERGYLVKNSPR